MSESSEFDPSEFEKALVIEVIRTVIESAVRYGDIQLEGRTDEAIKKDIHEYIRARLAEPNIFGSPAQYDYQSELINEARRYEGMGDFNLAHVLRDVVRALAQRHVRRARADGRA